MRQDFLMISIVLIAIGAVMMATAWVFCFTGVIGFILLMMGVIFLLLAAVMDDKPGHPSPYPPPMYWYPPPPMPYYSPCPYCRVPMQFNMGRYWCPRCQRYV